jgi:hypothetical protein
MAKKRWFCVGEDVESTQELKGTPEDNCIGRESCRYAVSATVAYNNFYQVRGIYGKEKTGRFKK